MCQRLETKRDQDLGNEREAVVIEALRTRSCTIFLLPECFKGLLC